MLLEFECLHMIDERRFAVVLLGRFDVLDLYRAALAPLPPSASV